MVHIKNMVIPEWFNKHHVIPIEYHGKQMKKGGNTTVFCYIHWYILITTLVCQGVYWVF